MRIDPENNIAKINKNEITRNKLSVFKIPSLMRIKLVVSFSNKKSLSVSNFKKGTIIARFNTSENALNNIKKRR